MSSDQTLESRIDEDLIIVPILGEENIPDKIFSYLNSKKILNGHNNIRIGNNPFRHLDWNLYAVLLSTQKSSRECEITTLPNDSSLCVVKPNQVNGNGYQKIGKAFHPYGDYKLVPILI